MNELALPVPLDAICDNIGRTTERARDAGAFNIWRNTFPAEELPEPGSAVDVGGVPFVLPGGAADNVRCAGQYVPVVPGRYDWIYVLATAERRTEDSVRLHFTGGAVDQEWLRVSDFWPNAAPHFGELAAYTCSRLHYPNHSQRDMPPTIWRQRIAVPRAADLVGVRLPDNPAIHVFAATLVRANGWDGT
jgi:hypothetical protein